MNIESIIFTKAKELFLDANPTLNWEARYHGTNGSQLILRTVDQAPDTITLDLEKSE